MLNDRVQGIFDYKGIQGIVWRYFYWLLWLLLFLKRGEHALSLPDRKDPFRHWWKENLYQVLRRRLSTQSTEAINLIVGLTALGAATLVALPLGSVLAGSEIPRLWQFALGTIGVVAAFVTWIVGVSILLYYSAYLSLRGATASDYATTVLTGRTAPAAIMVTAYEIRSFCKSFNLTNQPLKQHWSKLESIRGHENANELLDYVNDKFATDLDRWEENFENEKKSLQEGLKKIAQMKTLLSRQFDIPHRKLCDQLLHFSPAIWEIRRRKFRDNWTNLRIASDTKSSVRYLLKNRAIHDAIKECQKTQEIILKNENLLSAVRKLAAQHSTSGSVLTYAKALSEAAENAKTQGSDYWEAARFLFAAQAAHPGMPPHDACTNILEDDSLSRQSEIVDLKALFRDLPIHKRPTSEPRLENLTKLYGLVKKVVLRAREDIGEYFVKHIATEFEGAEVLYVLTSGYSKTVRECLVKALTEPEIGPKIRVFAAADKDILADDVDTRRMVYELRQLLKIEKLMLSTHQATENLQCEDQGAADVREEWIGQGDAEILQHLLASDTAVLWILGVEAYWSDHVIHARANNIAQPSNIDVYFAAESYKHCPKIMENVTVFRFHIDQLSVYDAPFYLATEHGVEERLGENSNSDSGDVS